VDSGCHSCRFGDHVFKAHRVAPERMPFTFSHPAAVLPFTKRPGKWYSVTGLVVGMLQRIHNLRHIVQR
jgi:hypothetical protein